MPDGLLDGLLLVPYCQCRQDHHHHHPHYNIDINDMHGCQKSSKSIPNNQNSLAQDTGPVDDSSTLSSTVISLSSSHCSLPSPPPASEQSSCSASFSSCMSISPPSASSSSFVCFLVSIPSHSYRHPQSWSGTKRAYIVLLYALTSLGTQVSTSMFGQSVIDISARHHVPLTCGMLPTAMFMFGVALGPLIIAPITEKYGRKRGILFPYLIAALLTMISFAARNFYVMLIMRFITGLFASAPIISSGSALKDMFDAGLRADVLLAYAVLVASGPTFGPVFGGLVTHICHGDHYPIFLLVGGYMTSLALLSILFIPETYVPYLTAQAIRRLQSSRPDLLFLPTDSNFSLSDTIDAPHKAIKASKPISASPSPSLSILPSLDSGLSTYLGRPYKLLATHLMAWMALYACIAFGVMYMGVSCMPLIVGRLYHWHGARASLFNVCHFVGILFGAVVNVIVNRLYRLHTYRVRQGLCKWVPEKRLYAMLVGGIITPLGFVILWLTHSLHWTSSAIAQVLLGAGFFTTFQSALNYVIDVHGHLSASAVSAVTLLRSLAAGILPLIATVLIDHLGISSFSRIMACVSAGLFVLPLIMYLKWGEIRARTPHVATVPS